MPFVYISDAAVTVSNLQTTEKVVFNKKSVNSCVLHTSAVIFSLRN